MKIRIGIWGWSYGGFMSSNCLFQGADTFAMAIAVAPVGSWRFYDTIYTERYMETPQENASGYDENSPISHVDKLEGDLLLGSWKCRRQCTCAKYNAIGGGTCSGKQTI